MKEKSTNKTIYQQTTELKEVVKAVETIRSYCATSKCVECAFKGLSFCPGSFLYFHSGIGATYSNQEGMRVLADERVETIKDYAEIHRQALSNKN